MMISFITTDLYLKQMNIEVDNAYKTSILHAGAHFCIIIKISSQTPQRPTFDHINLPS